MYIKLCLLLFTLLLQLVPCLAQTTAEEMIRTLAGNKARAWSFQGTVTTLGNGCKNGRMLVFEKDSLTEKICDVKVGKWATKRYAYKLIKRNDYSWKMEYNGQTYYVDIRKKNGSTELALSSVGVGLKEDIYVYED